MRFADPTDVPTEERTSEDERFALDSFQLRLAPNEVLGLLGRTGSGKTTLARLLLRLHDVDSGRLLVAGRGMCAGGLCANYDAGGNGHPKRTAVSGVDSGQPDLL